MKHARLAAAVLLVTLPRAALAQMPAPPAAPSPALTEARAKMRSVCAGDVQKFCAETERGALRACLRAHQAELSAACQSARVDVRAIRRREKG